MEKIFFLKLSINRPVVLSLPHQLNVGQYENITRPHQHLRAAPLLLVTYVLYPRACIQNFPLVGSIPTIIAQEDTQVNKIKFGRIYVSGENPYSFSGTVTFHERDPVMQFTATMFWRGQSTQKRHKPARHPNRYPYCGHMAGTVATGVPEVLSKIEKEIDDELSSRHTTILFDTCRISDDWGHQKCATGSTRPIPSSPQ